VKRSYSSGNNTRFARPPPHTNNGSMLSRNHSFRNDRIPTSRITSYEEWSRIFQHDDKRHAGMLVMGPKKIIQNIVQQANIKLENRFRDWGDIFKNLNLIYEDEFPDPQSKPKYVDICDMFHKMDPVAGERLLQLSVFRIYAVPIEQTLDQFAEELETHGELVILNAQEEKVFDGLQSIQPEISKRIRVNKSTKLSYNKYIQFLQKHTQDYYYIVGIETCSLGASLGGWHNCDLTFPGGYSERKDTLQCAINIAQRETAILFGHVCDYYIQKKLRHGVPGLEDLPLFVESKKWISQVHCSVIKSNDNKFPLPGKSIQYQS